MPLCVYLCHQAGCQTKIDRWMPTSAEGESAAIECPRCGYRMKCVWTGEQEPTPNLKDILPPVRF